MADLIALKKAYGQEVEKLAALAEAGGDAYNTQLEATKAAKAAVERMSEVEAMQAAAAKTLEGLGQPSIEKGVQTLPAQPIVHQKLEPGINLARTVLSLAATKGQGFEAAAKHAETRWGSSADPVVKNLLASVGTAGGFLVPEDFRNEIIPLLRPRSVIYASNPRTIDMPKGNLTLPGLNTGVSATYIGETQAIPPSTETYRAVVLTAKKLAALIPISNDFLRFSIGNADQFVRDDMVQTMATTADQVMLRSLGTQFTPKGLRGWVQDVSATNVITANTTISLANVKSDLGKAELALLNANIPWVRPGWIFSPRTQIFLQNMMDGNGNAAFPEIANGTLRGKPFKVTTSVPDNIGGTSVGSEIYLCEFSEFIIGDAMGLEIDTQNGASYWDGTNTVSGFSQDQTVMRALQEHDTGMRQPKAIVMIDDARWIP